MDRLYHGQTKLIIDMGLRTEILPGTSINYLVVLKELPHRIRTNGQPRRMLLCKCVCGKEKIIIYQSVYSGRVSSCGCKQREIVAKGKFALKHGLSSHPIFTVWKRMIDRCTNPSHKGYKYYGGRGIKICAEWYKDPRVFYNWAISSGWAKGLQLDRTNNDGDYEPSNCRFVSREINMSNRRPYQKRKKDNLLDR